MLRLRPSRRVRAKKGFWRFPGFEEVALFLFIFLFPSQLARHYWPQFAYVFGLRIDYLAPAIYLTDVLFLLLVPFLFRRLRQKSFKRFLWPATIIIVLAFANIILAKRPVVSFLRWITVFKLILVGLYFATCRLKNLGTILRVSLLTSAFFFVFLGLIQFVLQRTIGGALYLLGERRFSSLTPGIALVRIGDLNFMRAYSTFSHPNSFAGFIIATVFIVSGLWPRARKVVLGLLLAAVSFSFSLGAFLGAILGFIFAFFGRKAARYLPAVLISLSLFFCLVPERYFLGNESLLTRLVLAKDSLKLFSQNPVFGVGLNNSVIFSPSAQPAHNVFLVIAAETGIGGLVLTFRLINFLLKKIRKEYLLAFFFILLTGAADHYWFTLQQNQLLLTLLTGLSLNEQFNKNFL